MKAALPLALLAAGACVEATSSPGSESVTLEAGERAYQKCFACHSLEGPDPTTQGPSLRDIVGRAVAAEPGFAYSDAMRAYAGREPLWTQETLDAFIADPQEVVPGNDMGFFGVSDADERRALIEYLARR